MQVKRKGESRYFDRNFSLVMFFQWGGVSKKEIQDDFIRTWLTGKKKKRNRNKWKLTCGRRCTIYIASIYSMKCNFHPEEFCGFRSLSAKPCITQYILQNHRAKGQTWEKYLTSNFSLEILGFSFIIKFTIIKCEWQH